MVRQKTGDETAQAGSTDHAEHPSVMGLVFNLRPGEVETYVSDFPRFLRVRPNENYDLLLDESILIDPSSMSVAVPRRARHGAQARREDRLMFTGIDTRT